MTLSDHSGLVSVGYEGRTITDLIALLATERVEILADVRLNAVSRKPGFSKHQLADACATAGIGYRHLPVLGNPRHNREALRRRDPHALDTYRQHLTSSAAADACRQLCDTATQTRVAVLCFERDHMRCHRACICEQATTDTPNLAVTVI